MPPYKSANRGNAWELREGQWVDVSADFQGMSEGEMTELGSELIVVGYACSMVLKQGQKFDRKKPDCASFRGPDVYVTSAKYLAKGKHTVWLEAANQLDKQALERHRRLTGGGGWSLPMPELDSKESAVQYAKDQFALGMVVQGMVGTRNCGPAYPPFESMLERYRYLLGQPVVVDLVYLEREEQQRRASTSDEEEAGERVRTKKQEAGFMQEEAGASSSHAPYSQLELSGSDGGSPLPAANPRSGTASPRELFPTKPAAAKGVRPMDSQTHSLPGSESRESESSGSPSGDEPATMPSDGSAAPSAAPSVAPSAAPSAASSAASLAARDDDDGSGGASSACDLDQVSGASLSSDETDKEASGGDADEDRMDVEPREDVRAVGGS